MNISMAIEHFELTATLKKTGDSNMIIIPSWIIKAMDLDTGDEITTKIMVRHNGNNK